MTFAVIIIVAALSFFPALALGPIADYLDFLSTAPTGLYKQTTVEI